MKTDPALSSIKQTLRISYFVLVAGGIVLLLLAMSGQDKAILGGAVGWGAGVGTAMYVCAHRVIAMLEARVGEQAAR